MLPNLNRLSFKKINIILFCILNRLKSSANVIQQKIQRKIFLVKTLRQGAYQKDKCTPEARREASLWNKTTYISYMYIAKSL